MPPFRAGASGDLGVNSIVCVRAVALAPRPSSIAKSISTEPTSCFWNEIAAIKSSAKRLQLSYSSGISAPSGRDMTTLLPRMLTKSV